MISSKFINATNLSDKYKTVYHAVHQDGSAVANEQKQGKTYQFAGKF